MAALRKTDSPLTGKVQDNLSKFILAAGEALATGGVHTPNHRWVICSALARTHSLFPADKYVSRIDDWLGEGIYCDADGQYSERSTGIYSEVIDEALITMSRLLNRPALLEPVRRNLDMNVYYIYPNGEIETVGSRRQDQFMIRSVSAYHLDYRYMAIKDQNRRYAAMTKLIESLETERQQLVGSLINFLEDPTLREKLPESDSIPTDYAKVFPKSSLARVRRGKVVATIYGGSDWPLGTASGLASNPTFFNFRKGTAVLESVRMGANFFSKGHFRSTGLKANGNQYVLEQLLEVPYYQPLPRADRNVQGDYPLTPAEDRFWSKMNFPKRPTSNIQKLNQIITITEKDGVFELDFNVTGPDRVPVTIELAFRSGGQLERVKRTRPQTFFLAQGIGQYRMGDDSIEFGPGRADHEWINLDGAAYGAHRGTLRPNSDCVYITWHTPLRQKLIIK